MAMAAAAEPLLVPTSPPPHPPPPPPPPQHYDDDDDDDDDDVSNSHHHYGSEDDVEDPLPNPPPPQSSSSSWSRKKMKRCNTAPAMAVMKDFRSHHPADPNYLRQSDSSYLLRQAAVLLIVYLSLGVVIYSFNRDHFSGIETHPVVDALYFCIVTMCTIGYGDIAPVTPIAKVFACVFVLVGFGFIDILLSGVVNNVLDMQENMILAGIEAGPPRQNRQNHEEEEHHHHHHHHHHHPRRFFARNYIIDVAKGRMRIRLKVGLALGVVVMCIGMGFLFLYFVEDLDVLDSVYLSVMSVTTVGYGDTAFKTLTGRLFASVWLLFSTLAVARAFLYLAEARIDKRHRKITNWVLHRDITVEDLLAADTNHNGFISKSEYVIYKLKEMGKIKETDILQICNQFNKLDPNNSGKITLPHLFDNHL